MNTDKPPEQNATTMDPNNDEALKVEFWIKVHGKGETAFEFMNHFDIPLAMRHAHLHSALSGYETLFDLIIKKPTQIGLTEFMEARFEKGRVRKPKQPSAESVLADVLKEDTTKPPQQADAPPPDWRDLVKDWGDNEPALDNISEAISPGVAMPGMAQNPTREKKSRTEIAATRKAA